MKIFTKTNLVTIILVLLFFSQQSGVFSQSFEKEEFYEITSPVRWDKPRSIPESIRIAQGGELLVSASIILKAGTEIIIKPGGKLVIDGGTITTACLDPWQGIEVQGNPHQEQLPAYQGIVKVINGGTISNAIAGIRAGRYENPTESGGSGNHELTSGIVQVDGGLFLNNRIAIEFLSYSQSSVSYIRNSTFENTSVMPASIEPLYFVMLKGINIQDISNCQFINHRTWLDADDPSRGSGIYTMNSKLYNKCSSLITPCPPTEYYPNTFTNLFRGISASNVGVFRTVSIISNAFENNYRSLYLSGVVNARVTSNEFIINTPFVENGGYGMYLDGCSGYWVEDNEFRHNGANATGIGLIVNNSGKDPNEIYRNRFIKLEQGISAQGNNKDPESNSGLQILCNDFVDTSADVLVPNPEENRGLGIAHHQGADSQNPQHMAGNLFHQHTGVDYNDINNEGDHITYYAPLNPEPGDDERAIPQEYTINTVTVVRVPLENPWTYETGCPCQLESGGGGHEEEMKQQMAESDQQVNGLQESLGLLIDAGDSESLFWDVYMSSSPEAMQVYQELMTASPYLSDTVVSAAIVKEDVLIDAMLRDIMVANPHTAKSGKLMEKLEQRWTPLPKYMKAQIMQGKSLVSVRENMESKLARHQLDKAIAVNALARNWHNNTDSLVWLWSTDNSPASKYKLAFLYLELGQAEQGTTVLNNIPGQMNLSAVKQAEHQQITAVYDMLTSLSQEGKSILEADSLQIATLLEFEAGSTGLAGVYARNALLALQALAYDEPILLPDLMKSKTMAEDYRKLLETRPPKNLGVFPIPARDFLVAEYVLDTENKGVIEFTDASGRLVHTLTVSGPVNQQIVDTRNWKPGWYIATLKAQTKTLESVKFIISD
jgi:hypothetical protein